MSRKDDWNREHYDLITLRTKYNVKERITQQSKRRDMSINRYIVTAVMKQLRRDEADNAIFKS